jgi:hypothetical protein
MISKQTHAGNNSDKKLVLMHVGYKVTICFFLGCYIYDDVQNTLPKNTRYSDKGQF